MSFLVTLSRSNYTISEILKCVQLGSKGRVYHLSTNNFYEELWMKGKCFIYQKIGAIYQPGLIIGERVAPNTESSSDNQTGGRQSDFYVFLHARDLLIGCTNYVEALHLEIVQLGLGLS